jgi:hypothetical protein
VSTLENRLNDDKLYLPVSYVSNQWTGKELSLSETYRLTWIRMGTFDLPKEIELVQAVGRLWSPGGGLEFPPTEAAIQQHSFTFKLSNHKLAE